MEGDLISHQDAEKIKDLAKACGFDFVGFSSLSISLEDQANLREFAEETAVGPLQWFRKYLPLRMNPRNIFPEAKSAIVLGTIYHTRKGDELVEQARFKISRYALGKDYHNVLRKKGKVYLRRIQEYFPEIEIKGRVTVDSAPVPEKILGRQAGIGWQGKNTNLIHPEWGSYFFISVLLLNVDLPRNVDLVKNHCKSCKACIEACPTNALQPYRIDASKCLSTHTIESKVEIPPSMAKNQRGWVFGCDICQEVCPFNKVRNAKAKQSVERSFEARDEVATFLKKFRSIASKDQNENHEISDEEFSILREGSAIGRVSHHKLNASIRSAHHG